MAFMMEADQFNKWLRASQGLLTHTLNSYDANPLWTEDPKRTVFRDGAKRSLTIGGLGSVGEKAANALSAFVLVDMFASYCIGREDAKGAMKIAERQLQRIYRWPRPINKNVIARADGRSSAYRVKIEAPLECPNLYSSHPQRLRPE